MDGLLLDWSAHTTWLNPSWELLEQIVDEILTQGGKGVIIYPQWLATVVRKRQQIARSENPPSSFLCRTSPPRACRVMMQPRSATSRTRSSGKRTTYLCRAPGPQC